MSRQTAESKGPDVFSGPASLVKGCGPMNSFRSLPVNIRVLCLTGLVEGLIAIGPLWALYVDELHGSLAALGFLLSLSSLCMSALQIPGGMFSDRLGRRRAIITGEVIRIVSLVWVGLVPRWEWLVPAIVVSNTAGALIYPAKSALVAESVADDRRGRTYGLVDTVQALTMIVGPALGLWIAGRVSIRLVFFLSALLASFSLAVTIRYLTDTAGRDRGPAVLGRGGPRLSRLGALIRSQLSFSRDWNLNLLLASQGLSMIAASFAAPFFTLFAVNGLGVAKEQLAVIFVAANVLLMITRVPMGRLADHPPVKRKYFLAWGCAWGGLVWILVSHSQGYSHLFAYALLSLAFVMPARSALISDLTTRRERASMFGTLSAIDGISGAVGYAIAGVFADAYGFRLSMNVAGIGLLLSALFVMVFFKEPLRTRVKRHEEEIENRTDDGMVRA